jgi:hypothetical protein
MKNRSSEEQVTFFSVYSCQLTVFSFSFSLRTLRLCGEKQVFNLGILGNLAQFRHLDLGASNLYLNKEDRAMKRTITAMLTILCVFLIAPAGYSDMGDLITEGKELIRYSQQLIDKGQMMKAYKDQDKAWMVDQGHLMIRKGENIISDGEMMDTDEGKSNTQEVGQRMMGGGNLLLKMGRKKEALTEKDTKKIVKEGEAMMGLGKLMLEKGKLMAP